MISHALGSSGTPSSRPLRGGGEQRLLDGVLGGVEVAVATHERAEDLRRQPAPQVLGAGRQRSHLLVPDAPMIGRTSTAANRASGKRAAISSARSGVAQSTTK